MEDEGIQMGKKLILLLLLYPLSMAGQSASGLIASNRYINWSDAGATIPTRNTQCGSTISAGASTATIAAALNACANSNQYVLLGAGTFNLSSTLFGGGAVTPSNVTLRGSGPTQTILNITAMTNNCNGNGPTGICIYNGDSGTIQYAANICAWTGGYSQGATSITLGSCSTGSLSNLKVGALLQVNQLDQEPDNGNWWNNATQCNSLPLPVPATCSTWGGSDAWPGRSQSQTVTVTGISGSTITISPGLYAPNWSGSLTPYALFSSSLPVTGFGLENLQVNTQSLGDEQAMVETLWATNSWISDVAFINADGVRTGTGGGATRKHAEISSSTHITIQNSYAFGSSPSSEGYGFDLTWGTSDSLVQNNITQHIASGTILETGVGNVFGYNYDVDNFYTGGGGAPNWQQCDAYHHDVGDYYNLWEGHEGICANMDDIHGTGQVNTLFRNYFNGWDPANTCPSSEPSCGTQTKSSNTFAVSILVGNRYDNVVANVLGTASYHNTYQNVATKTYDSGGNPGPCTGYPQTAVYSLNFADGGNQLAISTGSGCYPAGSFSPALYLDNDPLAASTTMFWGNWDVVHGATQTNANETSSNASVYPGLVSPSTSYSAYPSLYLSSKPSWWVFPSGNSSTPWPAVGPDITGGNVTGVGGHVYLNPAANCYLNVLGGHVDGSSGSFGSTFDAANCYAGGGGGTTYSLTVSTAGTGSGSFSGFNCATGTYASGASVTCTATPAAGSTLASVSGTGAASSCTASPCTFTMSAAATVTATFNLSSVTYTLTVATSGTGTGTVAGAAAPVYVQSALTPTTGSSTLAYTSNVTAANALYAAVRYGVSGAAITFTDSASNSWTTIKSGNLSTDGDTVALGCAPAGSSGADTVTFNVSGVAAAMQGAVYEVQNATCTSDATPIFGYTASGATLCDSGAITTSTPNDLLVGVCGLGNLQSSLSNGPNWTHPAIFSNSTFGNNGLAEIQVASQPGSFHATSTTLTTAAEQGTIEAAFNGNINCVNGTLNAGTTVTCTAFPASGSNFSGWTVTGGAAGSCSGTTNPCSLNISANTNVTAAFTSTAQAATPTFSPSGGSQTVGTAVTISTSSSGCGPYIYWALTSPPDTGSVHGTSFTIQAAATWYAKVIGCPGFSDSAVGSASFTTTPNSYSLTVLAVNGTVTNVANCATGTNSLTSGTSVSCTAVPAAGFTFAGWTGNPPVCGTSAACTFNLTGNVNLSPVFVAPPTGISGEVISGVTIQ